MSRKSKKASNPEEMSAYERYQPTAIVDEEAQ